MHRKGIGHKLYNIIDALSPLSVTLCFYKYIKQCHFYRIEGEELLEAGYLDMSGRIPCPTCQRKCSLSVLRFV